MKISRFVYVGHGTWMDDKGHIIEKTSRGMYELIKGDKLIAVQNTKQKAESFAK